MLIEQNVKIFELIKQHVENLSDTSNVHQKVNNKIV